MIQLSILLLQSLLLVSIKQLSVFICYLKHLLSLLFQMIRVSFDSLSRINKVARSVFLDLFHLYLNKLTQYLLLLAYLVEQYQIGLILTIIHFDD